jgi:hypothetical protein
MSLWILWSFSLTDKLCLLSTLKSIHRLPLPPIQKFSQQCKHPMSVMWGVALALYITSVRICNGGARFGFTRFVTFWFRSGSTETAAVWWLSVCSVLSSFRRFKRSWSWSYDLASSPFGSCGGVVGLWWCRRRFWGDERLCTLWLLRVLLFFSFPAQTELLLLLWCVPFKPRWSVLVAVVVLAQTLFTDGPWCCSTLITGSSSRSVEICSFLVVSDA